MSSTELQVGMPAPLFTLPGFDNEPVSLESFRGQGVILYFYPKDNTAGCTTEALGFRARKDDFAALGYTIIGISRDSVKTHCGFRDRQDLNFLLLSDKEEVACKLYDVIKEKMMCGKKCMGIERSTFVISPEGNLTHILRGVKAKTHVEELYELLQK